MHLAVMIVIENYSKGFGPALWELTKGKRSNVKD